MSIAHCKAKAKYSAFHALHQSCIGVDVHANLIVGVYQRAQFGKTTIEEQYWNSDAIKSSLLLSISLSDICFISAIFVR